MPTHISPRTRCLVLNIVLLNLIMNNILLSSLKELLDFFHNYDRKQNWYRQADNNVKVLARQRPEPRSLRTL